MANKGEWSEVYVALKLLAYQKLYMADENGDKNRNEWMDVLKIIRHESGERTVSYICSDDSANIEIAVNNNGVRSVPASQFQDMADRLKKDITESSSTSFYASDEVSDFLGQIEITSLKAKSMEKSDIFLDARDPRAAIIRTNIGFSIKSEFGQNPTLFNTAKASAAIYRIHGNMNDELMEKINSMVDEKNHVAMGERCEALNEYGCQLEYVGYEYASRAKCCAFEENLDLINPRLKTVLARIMTDHFMDGFNVAAISGVMERIINENPCGLNNPDIKYPYMMKTFLYDAYCGMTASTVWDGKSTVNGGYITVKQSGDVIANYAIEGETFKNYLYTHCYLDYPSTDPKHGDYGKVYFQNGDYYFKLNFQIRVG